MPRWFVLILVGLGWLGGCAGKGTPPPVAPDLVAAPLIEAPATPPAVVIGPTILPELELQALESSEPPWLSRPAENTLQVIQQANKRASRPPRREHFEGAIARLPHQPGFLYTLPVGVDAPLTVMIPADEELIMYQGLDTKRWVVKVPEDHESGTPMYLLIAPREPKLKGRLTVVTTKAAYMMELQSQEHPGLAAVSWVLPAQANGKPRYDFLAPGEYRVGYKVEVLAGHPVWAPSTQEIAVWDTGPRGKTLIRFPEAMLTHHAPVLYSIGPDGQRQPVNYRKRGLYYEVDQLMVQAELRVGHDDDAGAEVVRITRVAPYRAIRCPGASECPTHAPRRDGGLS